MRLPTFLSRARDANGYLPFNASPPPVRCAVYTASSRRRTLICCIFSIPLLLCIALYLHISDFQQTWMYVKYSVQSKTLPPMPPTYDHYYEMELRYPQHNESLPSPEGREGRFLYISNQHCCKSSTCRYPPMMCG